VSEFTEHGAFPVKDREGYPLGIDSFVRVASPSKLLPGRVMEYRGLVKAIRSDKKGGLVEIREWYGRFTGRQCVARPEHCTVERAPKKLRNEQASRARRQAARPVLPAGGARAVRRKPLA
jgi:hypothetical protein